MTTWRAGVRARVLTALLASGCAVFAARCSSATETGNPVTSKMLALSARSSDDAVALGDRPVADGVAVSAAWVVIGEIRLIEGTTCADGDDTGGDDTGGGERFELRETNVINLIGEPTIADGEIPETTYCRIRMNIDRAESLPAGAPAELQDASIVLQGVRADGTRFVIRSRRKNDCEVRSRGTAFELSDAKTSLILSFDLGRWLSGVKLDSAAVGSDGVIHIDDDNEKDLLDQFENNVDAALELFRDENDNHELDGDEDKAPIASGE